MPYLFVQHDVADYDEWKPGFDDHDATRVEFGQRGYRLFRATDDPNSLYLLVEFDTTENARAFMEESDVEAKMAELGVQGEPEVAFLDEIEEQSESGAGGTLRG